MSDTIDNSDSGAQAQDQVAGFIGDKNDAEAVRWYGLYSGILTLIGYFFWKEFSARTWGFPGFWSATKMAYLPVFTGWLLVSYFDGEFMRTVFGMIVIYSVLTVNFTQWNLIISLFISNKLDDVDGWITVLLYSAFNIFQGIVQLILVPQIRNWSD